MRSGDFEKYSRRRPTLPPGCPGSTIGAEGRSPGSGDSGWAEMRGRGPDAVQPVRGRADNEADPSIPDSRGRGITSVFGNGNGCVPLAMATGIRPPPRQKNPRDLRMRSGDFEKYSRRRPTLPPGCPGSTIGAEGLNFRVRNGNGCVPLAMATGILISTAKNLIIEYLPYSRLPVTARLTALSQEHSFKSGVEVMKKTVKPHGLLVPVSSTCCHASTSGLSTS